jgi:glycogen synthase
MVPKPKRSMAARRGRSPQEAMRILFLSREYPPETAWGGIASYLACLAPALVERGHEVHVLSCVTGQQPSDRDDRGVSVHRRPRITTRVPYHVQRYGDAAVDRLRTAISCYLELPRLGTDFDVVEAPDWGAEGLFISLRRKYPVVTTLHAPIHVFRSVIYRRGIGSADMLERTATRRSTVVVSPSGFLRTVLTRDGWLGKSVPLVVPNPIELDRWPVAGQPSRRPSALVVGRLQNHKHPELVVEAAARLRDIPDFSAVFVGGASGKRDGAPYDVWLRQRADELGAPCEFRGAVDRASLPAVYGEARVVVIPSFENLPTVGLEALASGRPLIVTTDNGLAPLVRETGAGDVVPPNDPAALAEAIKPYLADPCLTVGVGARGRAAVAAEYAVNVVAAHKEAVYQYAIERHRARRR